MSSDARRFAGAAPLMLLVPLALLAIAAGTIAGRRIAADPDVPLLIDENGAAWIHDRAPITLRLRHLGEHETRFSSAFRVDSAGGPAILYFRAMKRAEVRIDGRLVYSEEDMAAWKRLRALDLGGTLEPGEHRLEVTVWNMNGPRLLLAYSDDLGVRTGDGSWDAAEKGDTPDTAQRADQIIRSESTRKFSRPADALRAKFPALLPAFLLIFFWTIREETQRPKWLVEFTPDPGQFRWLLLGAWALLGINNAFRIPPEAGFDIEGHMEYVAFVVANRSLPLASNGWQMFQTPLFYLVAAVPYALLDAYLDPETLTKALRVIPLLCGAAQIEISYRIVRHAFPARTDLQIAGTTLGGFLPINIYMSQFVANEPMVALFTGLVILVVVRLLTDPAETRLARTFALIGLLVGLAILSKITAVLLIPPLLGIAAYAAATRYGTVRACLTRTAAAGGAMLAVMGLVTGWAFVRNWLALGKPFVGGWDPVRTIVWWQEPGYRTPEQLYHFGESLTYPMYAGAAGLPDSLYATLWLDSNLSGFVEYFGPSFWDYRFLVLGAWLGLVPMFAIATGAARAFASPSEGLRNGTLFAATCIAIYVAAIAYLYLRLPVYSTAKASYTLGLASCYALLAASGLDVLARWRPLRAVLFGLMAVWAVNAYLTYFAI